MSDEPMTPEQEIAKLEEVLALIWDKADDYLAGTVLAVSAEIHVRGLTNGMREIREMVQPWKSNWALASDD